MPFFMFNPANLLGREIGIAKTFAGRRYRWDGKRWKKPTLAEEINEIDDENLDSAKEWVEFMKANRADLEAIKSNFDVEFNADNTQMRIKKLDGSYTEWVQIKGDKGDVGATFELSADGKTLTIRT